MTRPSFRSTTADQWYAFVLAAITIFHFWLSAHLPPTEDELYYWTWAKDLEWSYFDHPPLVAWLIAFSTKLFGDGLFGIRFFACVGSLAIFVTLGTLCQRRWLLLLCLFTPIFFVGGVLMTPDLPLLVFWTLYLAWLVGTNKLFTGWSGDPISRVYQSSPIAWFRWVGGGALLGLGILSKYTMLMAIPCAFLVLATRYRWRAWLPGFAFHLAVAAVVTLPILFFNQAHAFVPLKFQWHHAMASGSPPGHFWNYLGSQILILGALPFFMLPWVIGKARDLNTDFRLHVCFYLFTLPFLYFFLKATGSYVEGNWPLVAYIGFWPIAERLLEQNSFKSVGRGLLALGFVIPVTTSLAVLWHVAHPLPFLSPRNDRVTRLKDQYELAGRVASDLAYLAPGETVLAPTYQWTSYLKFLKTPADQLFPEGRKSQFTLAPTDVCTKPAALVFEDAVNPPQVLSCFPHHKVLKEYPLVVRGVEVGRFRVTRYTRAAETVTSRPAARVKRPTQSHRIRKKRRRRR